MISRQGKILEDIHETKLGDYPLVDPEGFARVGSGFKPRFHGRVDGAIAADGTLFTKNNVFLCMFNYVTICIITTSIIYRRQRAYPSIAILLIVSDVA